MGDIETARQHSVAKGGLPANAGDKEIDSSLRRSRDALMNGIESRMYSQAMKRAKGEKAGTMMRMTENENRKFSVPESIACEEAPKAPSMVLMSEVNLFKIRPMGVTSKKRAGALTRRRNMALNSVREACRPA